MGRISKTLFISLLSLLFLCSCGKNPLAWNGEGFAIESTAPIDPVEPEMYSYHLFDAGCDTGEHAFLSLTEVCLALLDDDLNKSCAQEERRELHANHCDASANS